MLYHRKAIGRFAVLAVAICMAGWIGLASATEEESVLVEKRPAPTIDAPKLAAPANAPTLPPPSNPAIESAQKQLPKAAAKRPFMRPAEPTRRVPATNALQVVEEPMPAPVLPEGAEIEVRPTPPIEYDADRDARRMYRDGEAEMVMITQNPADGCYYEIPLCLPACCAGEEPIFSSGRGILGRGVVEYCWPCGFRAIVKFRHVLGDVKVEYEGD